MKIVVIGGTGLIGTALMRKLTEQNHDVVAVSRSAGIDLMDGEAVRGALQGADTVIDTSNVKTGDPAEMMNFFQQAGQVLTEEVRRAGIRHHILLSAVGADRLSLSGFFLAKLMQENLVRTADTPHTILRSTPFFETIYGIASDADDGAALRLPPIPVQAVAADDVAGALADIALRAPENQTLEIGGPETFTMTDLAIEILAAYEDGRQVVADPHAPYFGAKVGPEKLVAENPWRVAPTRFEDWLRQCLAAG
jgi:uncharacterized protein YbjT (DUF2867 family)